MTTHRTSEDQVRRRAHFIGARAACIAAGVLGGLIGVAAVPARDVAAAAIVQADLVGPQYSRFGEVVTVLPNGNYVVTDPGFDRGTTVAELDLGAVHLYNGTTHTPISTLTGTTANDRVGEGGVTVLTNGNYVVSSPNWNNAGTADVGAVTWVNGATGISGPVTTGNSLYGILATTRVGSSGITALTNGNYVVSTAGAGTVTWANGTTGSTGPVTINNSLHGTAFDDDVGSGGVTALLNATTS